MALLDFFKEALEKLEKPTEYLKTQDEISIQKKP